MTDEDHGLSDLEPTDDKKIGIAKIALDMAMKYHQLEAPNTTDLHLAKVFETAKRIEKHLLAASDRILAFIIEAIAEPPEHEDEDGAADPPAPRA